MRTLASRAAVPAAPPVDLLPFLDIQRRISTISSWTEFRQNDFRRLRFADSDFFEYTFQTDVVDFGQGGQLAKPGARNLVAPVGFHGKGHESPTALVASRLAIQSRHPEQGGKVNADAAPVLFLQSREPGFVDEAEIAQPVNCGGEAHAEMLRHQDHVVHLDSLGSWRGTPFSVQDARFVVHVDSIPAGSSLGVRVDELSRTPVGHEEGSCEGVGPHFEQRLAFALAANRASLLAIQHDVGVLVRVRKAASQHAVPRVGGDEYSRSRIGQCQPADILRQQGLRRADALALQEIGNVRKR